MKTFPTEYIDSSDSRVYRLCGYDIHGDSLLGVMGYKHDGRYIQYELVKLDEWDKNYLYEQGVKLKDGEIVGRLDSDTCRISDQKPLVKINEDRGLIYFLDWDTMNGSDTPIFETRGIKCDYLKLIKQ